MQSLNGTTNSVHTPTHTHTHTSTVTCSHLHSITPWNTLWILTQTSSLRMQNSSMASGIGISAITLRSHGIVDMLWGQFDKGTVCCGNSAVRTDCCGDGLPWAQTAMGGSPLWEQSAMRTAHCGNSLPWEQPTVGTVCHENSPLWEQSAMGTAHCGNSLPWEQCKTLSYCCGNSAMGTAHCGNSLPWGQPTVGRICHGNSPL